MAFAYTRLAQTTIPAAAGALITNAVGKTTYVRLIIIHNANTTTEVVILWNVPDNAAAVGTAADTNQFYKESLTTLETRIIEFPAPGLMLTDTNDTIQGDTTTASKVTFSAYGGLE